MNKYLLNMPENLQMNPQVLGKIYQDLFGEKQGTFVEIGAFDGWSWSHTYTLARLGWKGYYVEPHPVYFQQCVELHKGHPNIECYNVAVSDAVGYTELYVKDATSTIVYDAAAEFGEVPKDGALRVPVTLMDSLLMRWNHPEIDVLVIDVEGSEPAVLEGFTIEKCLPKLAIVETHELSGWPHRGHDGINHKSVKCDEWFLGKK